MQHPPLLVGRDRQLDLLGTVLDPDGPWCVMVQGLGGVGKSTLLRGFAAQPKPDGLQCALLDCGSIEPTEHGLHAALEAELGAPVELLSSDPGPPSPRLVLLLDHVERFRLMDTWIRRELVARAGGRIRLVMAGRSTPSLAWTADPELSTRFRVVELDSLGSEDARELLRRSGVEEAEHDRIVELTRGHPLALRLASVRRAGGAIRGATIDEALRDLTRFYLDEIDDPQLREAVEASSTVRRLNASILGAMLGVDDGNELCRRLEELHFFEARPDGICPHDAVHEHIATDLRGRDPRRFAGFRRAAFRQLRDEIRSAPAAQLWRYTADLIYLIENPVIREAFFPTTESAYSIEPAQPEDRDTVMAISAQHEPPSATESLEHWWDCVPQSFFVARDRAGEVEGFYCSLDTQQIAPELFDDDPVTRAWWEDFRDSDGDQALFLRRWLSATDGESPSPIQAACWLDLKRSYLELRPRLRRVYLTLRDPTPYLPVALRLGFAPLASASHDFDGVAYHTAVLDFGPHSVDGWMRRLFARELGESDEDAPLDYAARQLRTPRGAVDLSPLEFGVLKMLVENEGVALSRSELLAEVWGIHHEGSSNVVDTVIRSVRSKFSPRDDRIETVRGFGYRYTATT